DGDGGTRRLRAVGGREALRRDRPPAPDDARRRGLHPQDHAAPQERRPDPRVRGGGGPHGHGPRRHHARVRPAARAHAALRGRRRRVHRPARPGRAQRRAHGVRHQPPPRGRRGPLRRRHRRGARPAARRAHDVAAGRARPRPRRPLPCHRERDPAAHRGGGGRGNDLRRPSHAGGAPRDLLLVPAAARDPVRARRRALPERGVKSAARTAVVPESELALAHARFAQVAMWIYVATAGVGIVLLVLTLAADRAHQKEEARERLSLETQVRAHYLARHLHLLVEELTRLGLRSEVDLLDENMAPERSLLRLSHENSAVFNVGVAILDRGAPVMWSEPQPLLSGGLPPLVQGLMGTLRRTGMVQIVPGQGGAGTSAPLYVASPIMRGAQFTGAMLGAIDLVSGAGLESGQGPQITTALGATDGRVIYPP